MIQVGLLGHGVVGSGVAELLLQNADVIATSAGQGIALRRVLDLRDFHTLSYGKLFTDNVEDIVADPSIDVVAECIGGVGFAYECVKRALAAGKHVVTSNKELVSACGEELLAIARNIGAQFLYEASTGGGIPVLHPIRHCLGANRLTRVTGILNGTTNFILTRMRDGGISFEAALAEAQANGYAEQDPSADVQGTDARRKTNILAHVAFGAMLGGEDIPTQGIDQLTREDMLYAREWNRSIKLLGVAELVRGGYTARVCPTMLPASHPLSNVSGVFNGVLVMGDHVDEVMFYGRGAGKEATASALVADIIDIASGVPLTDRTPSHLPFVADAGGETRFFARMRGGEAEAAIVSDALPGALVMWPENPLMAGTFAVITPEGAEDVLQSTLRSLPMLAGAIIRYEGA